jgi:tetratricopeptide (TPR) repeat protein
MVPTKRRVAMKLLSISLVTAIGLSAQSDPRIIISTLVREDIFAGVMANDMTSLGRGESTLEQLDRERPGECSMIRAWQGTAAFYRAVRAYESGNASEGDRFYAKAHICFDEALRIAPNSLGVWSVGGFANATFADRLPSDRRAASWAEAYNFYQKLAARQMPLVEKLPVHDKGELLAGVTMSAQRTGRQEEYLKSLDKMIEIMANTPYAGAARSWKKRPETVAKTSLLCKTCHEPGRLVAWQADLANAPHQ